MVAWRWWPMMIITIAVLGGAFVLGIRVFVTGETVFGLAVLGLAALFGWQMGSLTARNRPRTFAPDAIPARAYSPNRISQKSILFELSGFPYGDFPYQPRALRVMALLCRAR